MAASPEESHRGIAVEAYEADGDAGHVPDSALAHIAALVGDDKDVLELGCGDGTLSRELRDRGCRVVGVEADPLAAQLAADACRRVVVGDVEALDLQQELGDDQFDVVVAADILEQVKGTISLLAALKPVLRPDGIVVASIRNVAHGSVRLALLRGSFPDGDVDGRGRPRLRFFTFETVRGMFEDAGFAIEQVEREERPIRAADSNGRSPESSAVVDTLAADPEARTYQFVVLARPTAAGEPTAVTRRLRVLAEAKASAEDEVARLRTVIEEQGRTIVEQTEHLDALAARMEFMARREQELRTMLLDAHELLARGVQAGPRDVTVRELEALIEERTAWAQGAVKDVEIRDVMIRDLQARLERIGGSPPLRLYRAARRLTSLGRG